MRFQTPEERRAGDITAARLGVVEDGTAPAIDADLSFLDGAEQEYRHWDFLNTGGDRWWTVNNSSIFDYSRRAYINGEYMGLTEVIAERVGHSDQNVGLDIAAGSNAQALQDLLLLGILGKALATNYEDRRPRNLRRDPRLDHVKGDLTSRLTWREIIDWQRSNAPEGLDIVMHRPVGGLQDLEPGFYIGAMKMLLDMIKPGRMMFSQVPRRVVNIPGALDRLCETVQERDDVEEVITTAPRPWKPHSKDEADLYAVVLKAA